jgi:hypothetical protein
VRRDFSASNAPIYFKALALIWLLSNKAVVFVLFVLDERIDAGEFVAIEIAGAPFDGDTLGLFELRIMALVESSIEDAL